MPTKDGSEVIQLVANVATHIQAQFLRCRSFTTPIYFLANTCFSAGSDHGVGAMRVEKCVVKGLWILIILINKKMGWHLCGGRRGSSIRVRTTRAPAADTRGRSASVWSPLCESSPWPRFPLKPLSGGSVMAICPSSSGGERGDARDWLVE